MAIYIVFGQVVDFFNKIFHFFEIRKFKSIFGFKLTSNLLDKQIFFRLKLNIILNPDLKPRQTGSKDSFVNGWMRGNELDYSVSTVQTVCCPLLKSGRAKKVGGRQPLQNLAEWFGTVIYHVQHLRMYHQHALIFL